MIFEAGLTVILYRLFKFREIHSEEYSICYFQLQPCRPTLYVSLHLSQYFIETHIYIYVYIETLENTHTLVAAHYTDLIRAQERSVEWQSAAENADLNADIPTFSSF